MSRPSKISSTSPFCVCNSGTLRCAEERDGFGCLRAYFTLQPTNRRGPGRRLDPVSDETAGGLVDHHWRVVCHPTDPLVSRGNPYQHVLPVGPNDVGRLPTEPTTPNHHPLVTVVDSAGLPGREHRQLWVPWCHLPSWLSFCYFLLLFLWVSRFRHFPSEPYKDSKSFIRTRPAGAPGGMTADPRTLPSFV